MIRRLLVAARVAMWLFIAPWVALSALASALRWTGRATRRIAVGAKDQARCPSGHSNDLSARWTCKCGFTFFGHAFDECPSCGQVAGWIACERCALGIRGPE